MGILQVFIIFQYIAFLQLLIFVCAFEQNLDFHAKIRFPTNFGNFRQEYEEKGVQNQNYARRHIACPNQVLVEDRSGFVVLECLRKYTIRALFFIDICYDLDATVVQSIE